MSEEQQIRKTKILIIQTAFLGDVILILPLVQTIKNVVPDTEVDVMCIPNCANVLYGHPDIRNVLVYDKRGKKKIDKFLDMLSIIRNEKYDIVFCPHRSFRSALLTYFSKARLKVGFDRNSFSFLLNVQVPYDPQSHEIERNIHLLQSVLELEIKEEQYSPKPKLHPSEKDRLLVNALFKDKENLISFAPCSKWFTKQLTMDKSAEIAKALIENNYTVTVLGGAEDFDFCKALEKKVMNNSLINLCGRLSPLQSYCAINYSKCLVTADSAAQHLGAAADKPIVLIYGSTEKRFGFYPLTTENIIIENNTLDCRPCTNHGKLKCPRGHFRCMNDLDVKEIIGAVKKLTQS